MNPFLSGNDSTGTWQTHLVGGVDPSGSVKAIAVSPKGEVLFGDGSTSSSSSPSVALTAAINTIQLNGASELSIALTKLRFLEIFCRNNATIRYAFESGKAQDKVDPYRTIPAGASQPISLPGGCSWSGTIYFGSDIPVTIEVEIWQEANGNA